MATAPEVIGDPFIAAGAPDQPDALNHDALARSVLRRATELTLSTGSAGEVIAIQGAWGRGKTDVLRRVVKMANARDSELSSRISAIAWINPWQYGTADLLTPLVIELLKKIPGPRRASKKSIARAARTIISAGLNFGMKSAALTLPAGPIYAAAAEPIKEFLSGMFDAIDLQDKEEAPDPDPVAKMGERFRELVEELVSGTDGDRILICVDDIDRCLPDRQVALLEAIRFLTTAGARASFIIAIDANLARQAVVTHFQTDAFDPDRYLDKIFDLRINLPALPTQRMNDLLKVTLACPPRIGGASTTADQLGPLFPNVRPLEDNFSQALSVPKLRNPRLVRRVVDRLSILASDQNSRGLATDAPQATLLIMWAGLAERWPNVRLAFQDSVDPENAFSLLRSKYLMRESQVGAAAIDVLPAAEVDPDLRQFINEMQVLGNRSSLPIGKLLDRFDSAMRAVGL